MVKALLESSLLGVLVGAGLAYWVTARHYRRERVDALFDRAISAVMAEEASRQAPQKVNPGHLGLSVQEAEQLSPELRKEGLLLFIRAAAEARAALANVYPYCPGVRPFSEVFEVKPEQVDEVIAMLNAGQRRSRMSPPRKWVHDRRN